MECGFAQSRPTGEDFPGVPILRVCHGENSSRRAKAANLPKSSVMPPSLGRLLSKPCRSAWQHANIQCPSPITTHSGPVWRWWLSGEPSQAPPPLFVACLPVLWILWMYVMQCAISTQMRLCGSDLLKEKTAMLVYRWLITLLTLCVLLHTGAAQTTIPPPAVPTVPAPLNAVFREHGV